MIHNLMDDGIARADAPNPAHSKAPNLLLHCGAKAACRDDVRITPTPPRTATWHPIPHLLLVEMVEMELARNGLTRLAQAHSLTRDGARYFGLIEVRDHHAPSVDYARIIGIRNSHDKRFPAGIVAGAQVFVCDNLSFSGEVRITRKHTAKILEDLSQLVSDAVEKVWDSWRNHDNRVVRYKNAKVSDPQAHDIVIRAVDAGALPPRSIPGVLGHWRNPAYAEFGKKTAWCLFNAFTECLKGEINTLARRTQIAQRVIDSSIGMTV